jgi:hypothetical protein
VTEEKAPPGMVDKAICGLEQYSLTKKKEEKDSTLSSVDVIKGD